MAVSGENYRYTKFSFCGSPCHRRLIHRSVKSAANTISELVLDVDDFLRLVLQWSSFCSFCAHSLLHRKSEQAKLFCKPCQTFFYEGAVAKVRGVSF
jgi:hypothetical protein